MVRGDVRISEVPDSILGGDVQFSFFFLINVSR